jgi:spore maturation protein CgeB
MKIVLFYHSLLSDWNHGSAHFLRGIATELIHRGHDVIVMEPMNSWSYENLTQNYGLRPLEEFQHSYPGLDSIQYDLNHLNLDEILDDADLVIAHEWNPHELIRRLGKHRAQNRNYRLFFHDTHHRIVTDFHSLQDYDLKDFDGVLAFGHTLSDLYRSKGLAQAVWTWHEAADTRVFYPRRSSETNEQTGDLVWMGNWEEERSSDVFEYLIRPSGNLGLRTHVYGVRYPKVAQTLLQDYGIEYCGWTANFHVPTLLSKFRATVQIPNSPYIHTLSGIPTIGIFEALACGVPLISAPWEDHENLFKAGSDFLVAKNGEEMEKQLKLVLNDAALASELISNGRHTILSRHTCAHRVDELLNIYKSITISTEDLGLSARSLQIS